MIDMLVLSVVSAIVIAITATIGSLIRLTFYDNDKNMIFVLLFCVFVFLPTAYCALDGITAKQYIKRCELENYTGIDKQCIIAARVVSK